MNALGRLVRRSLGVHGRAAIGLAVVVALAGGLSLATFAAARRTASAFTRYLDATDAADLSIALFPEGENDTPPDYLGDTERVIEAGRALPGVERSSTHVGLTSMYLGGPDGRARPDTPEPIGSLDGRFWETDRVTVLEGRLPRQDRLDEVLVNSVATERYGMTLGSEHELVTIAGGDEVVDVAAAEVIESTGVRVVGVGRFPEEVLRDEYDYDGLLLTTPALTERYLQSGFPYRFQALHLAPGADPSAVVAGYEALAGEDYGLIVRRTDEQRDGAQLALRPIVVALAVFGALTGVAALSLASLGALRMTAGAAGDVSLLRAMGVPRLALVLSVAAPALIGTAVGSLGAVVLATVLSPIAPVGPVRAVEPRRGVDLDWTVFIGGLGALVVLLGIVVLLGAALVVRRRGRTDVEARRVTWLASWLGSLGLGPAASVGVREGLGLGGARAGTAVRPTLASCTVSVVALVTTLTFGASIDGLLDTPDRYGWSADRALVAGAGYITIPPSAADALAAEDEVRSVALASYGPVQLGGSSVSAIGLDPLAGEVAATVLDGRLPRDNGEVALGTNTARDLDAGMDDVVDSSAGDVRVVGIVALPAIGLAGVSHPSMSQGAVFTPEGLSTRNRSAFPAVAFLEFEDGVDHAAAAGRVQRRFAEVLQVAPSAVAVHGALRPAVLAEVESAKATAFGLAGLLAVAAVLALAFTLGSSVAQRRSQLAVLAALGFDHRDLRRSIRWQAWCLVGVALLLGLPLGVVVGRLAWTAFAAQIGVTPAPEVPGAVLAGLAVAIALLASAVGERPARAAARTSAAAALRPLA